MFTQILSLGLTDHPSETVSRQYYSPSTITLLSMRVISPPTSTPGQLPVDIQALVNQTISSLKDLVPPTASIVKDTIKDAIFQAIDAIDADMRELNLAIHENPELGFKDKAHENLVASLSKLGFDVTNPSTCGHNLIAVVGVAAAVGLKAALKACNIAGTVKLIGTPAEEGGGGKVILLREGVYDDLDACAMAHPGGGSGPPEYEGSCTVGGPGTLARAGFEIEFFGRGAHAGAAPWMGINALDAAVQGYTAVSMLRQQLEPTMRVHGIILGSEQWAQNIIPSYSKVSYSTRALDVKSCLELRGKVVACFKAAAEATGCTMKVKAEEDEVYADLRNNEPMAYSYQAFMENVIGQKITMGGMSTASTDFGNVCYKVPAIHPGFEIPCPLGSGNHTAGFTESAGKLEAHKLAMKVAKGLAAVGAKFLVDDSFADETKKAFERFKRGKGRKCQ
ncbi:hypothetical protein I350_05368 [Cryptococcus amylolentus CBS 6273]|uniref:Peptidase M20 domain-containing protein 2 n=1 Tax=Cryptococcus amylolentus CBS 6273 TaxID=1296118 RepID=A0A1E3JV96_9TREE|nr:hypothetical protein I350_05368 [Cryptococcus amylolentus CBS 6273]